MHFIIQHAHLLLFTWLVLSIGSGLFLGRWFRMQAKRHRATVTLLRDYRPSAVQSPKFLKDRKASVN